MHDDMTSMLILCLGLLAYSESVGTLHLLRKMSVSVISSCKEPEIFC